jgi:hypothetical protein
MFWPVLQRTLVLMGFALLVIAVPIGAMLLRDWRFAHSFASAHQGSGNEPVTYRSAFFFFSHSWQDGLLTFGTLLGLCLLIALLWTLLAKRWH